MEVGRHLGELSRIHVMSEAEDNYIPIGLIVGVQIQPTGLSDHEDGVVFRARSQCRRTRSRRMVNEKN